ncbi:MAG TPA: M14 metallopeptidase family protein, partial [bacterium]
MKRFAMFFSILILVLFISQSNAQIQTPDNFFGFPVGADRQLADYHQIVAYFNHLEGASPKIKILNLGKTTDNNDLILAIISSQENIANLSQYQKISYQLAHPADLSEAEAENSIQQGRVFAFITCNIHSTEIAATQMAVEFAYQLVTSNEPEILSYLDNVILLLMPSANPDGMEMVVDWYRKWVGTEFEGGSIPWLYHRYVGHDTNRDFFMLNQKESKLINHVMSRDWFPQVHLDEHQMGSRGPRMFVPPYKDPMSDNLSPMLMRVEALFGSNMSFRLEEQNKAGVVDSYVFDSYWPGGTRTAAWKNIVSMLTEMASCNIASPIFIDDIELSAGGKGLIDYKQQVNFPNPWRGGWWRLRDIMDYELIASYSFLETSAKYRKDILRSFYMMNLSAIKQGKEEPPFAYVIPPEQHDPITAAKLAEILLEHGIEIYQSKQDIVLSGKIFPASSMIIPLAQPLRPFIKEIMEVQTFPEIRLSSDGEPLSPYDVTAWSLPIQMGVKCVSVDQSFQAELERLTAPPYPAGKVLGTSSTGYAISHRFNNTSAAVNRLTKDNYAIFAATSEFADNGKIFEAGTIIIPAEKGIDTELNNIAKDLHFPIFALTQELPPGLKKIKPVRLGLYKPWRASMDEGWTRWLL